MHFKFNQVGFPAELLLTGLQIPREAWLPCCILEGRRGVAPVKMCIEARCPCEATVTSRVGFCK